MVTQAQRDGFSRRLNETLDDAGFPAKGAGRQSELATRYGVSQKGARKWLEAEGIPTMTRLGQIASDFDRDVTWLLTGKEAKPTHKESAISESQGRYKILIDLNSAHQKYAPDANFIKQLNRFSQLLKDGKITAPLLKSMLDMVNEMDKSRE